MRLHGDVVALLYGRCDGYGAWAAPYALPLKLSVLQLAVHVLRVVRGNIDECRVEACQLVDGGIECLDAVALQGRQHLEREAALVAVLPVDVVSYCHLRVNAH